jgi:hypothetical protein
MMISPASVLLIIIIALLAKHEYTSRDQQFGRKHANEFLVFIVTLLSSSFGLAWLFAVDPAFIALGELLIFAVYVLAKSLWGKRGILRD